MECGCCCCGCGATYTGDCTCFAETRDDDAAVAKSAGALLFGKTDELGAAIAAAAPGDWTRCCSSLRFHTTLSADLSSSRSQPWWWWCSSSTWWWSWWWSWWSGVGNHSEIHTGLWIFFQPGTCGWSNKRLFVTNTMFSIISLIFENYNIEPNSCAIVWECPDIRSFKWLISDITFNYMVNIVNVPKFLSSPVPKSVSMPPSIQVSCLAPVCVWFK